MARQIKSKARVVEHGEVFTAEREVHDMLDLVKHEAEKMDSRFLEPACGDGNFLSEILKRKLEIAKKKYGKSPFDFGKNSLLAVCSIYGIDIQMDNVIECRERLYRIWEKEYESVCKKECNDDTRRSIRFILERNILCGNSLSLMCVNENGEDTDIPIVFSEWAFITGTQLRRKDCKFGEIVNANQATPDMKFDVIIGNPPYQMSDGGSGTGISAKPIYHFFVNQAKKLNPNYLVMIIPSRWFAGGKGLDDFRESMLNDRHLRKIVDFMSSKDCFPGVNIAGGVNFFLWDRLYEGDCTIINRANNEKDVEDCRTLNEFPVFIRDNRAISIIHKFLKSGDANLAEHTYARNPFGFVSKERGETKPIPGQDCVKLISSGGVGYVRRSSVMKTVNEIDRFKVTIGKIVPSNGEVDVEPKDGYKVTTSSRILEPGEIHTETYLLLHGFDTFEEADHFAAYMALKFPRFMMKHTLSSMNISTQNFMFVPFLDYKKAWTDKELYARYGLDETEIAYVEALIRPMERKSGN